MKHVDNETPYHAESEQFVLGVVFLDSKFIYPLLREVKDESYLFVPLHRAVYKGMKKVYDKQSKANKKIHISPALVADELGQQMVSSFGGLAAITNLTYGLPPFTELDAFFDKIKEYKLARDLLYVNSRYSTRLYERDSPYQVLDTQIAELMQLKETKGETRVFDMKDATDSFKEKAERQRLSGKPNGFTTGLPEWDARLGQKCLERGGLTIIHGKKSTGKTALKITIAKANARAGLGVLYHTREMNKETLVKRMAAEICGIPNKDINDFLYRKNPDEYARLLRAMDILSKLPIYIDEESENIDEITAQQYFYAKNHNVGLFLVDYLQLYKGKKSDTRDRELGTITYQLKQNALRLNAHCVIGAQLMEEKSSLTLAQIAQGDEQRPLMRTRETGNAENDADNSFYLWMRRKDWKNAEEQGTLSKLPIMLYCEKHREGEREWELGDATKNTQIIFEKDYQRFMTNKLYAEQAKLGGFEFMTNI